MIHRHPALSDPWVVEHAKWKYDAVADLPMVELIRRLSAKPYASHLAAFWQMERFYIAGPMTWTGEQFEGEATAFVSVHVRFGTIHVAFSDQVDSSGASGGVDECERLIDAYVTRILHAPTGS